ncbi:hypothetical protein ACFL4W_03060 [Planctomycetota bacterium]
MARPNEPSGKSKKQNPPVFDEKTAEALCGYTEEYLTALIERDKDQQAKAQGNLKQIIEKDRYLEGFIRNLLGRYAWFKGEGLIPFNRKPISQHEANRAKLLRSIHPDRIPATVAQVTCAFVRPESMNAFPEVPGMEERIRKEAYDILQRQFNGQLSKHLERVIQQCKSYMLQYPKESRESSRKEQSRSPDQRAAFDQVEKWEELSFYFITNEDGGTPNRVRIKYGSKSLGTWSWDMLGFSAKNKNSKSPGLHWEILFEIALGNWCFKAKPPKRNERYGHEFKVRDHPSSLNRTMHRIFSNVEEKDHIFEGDKLNGKTTLYYPRFRHIGLDERSGKKDKKRALLDIEYLLREENRKAADEA